MKLSPRDGRRFADRLIDPPEFPAAEFAPEPAGYSTAGIDDATAAYMAELRDPFELLRQAEAQLAGLMVLATASGQAIAAHPMLDLAAGAMREAEDGIRAAKVPAPARHHHTHVLQAMRDMQGAVTAARRCFLRGDETAIDAVLAPLRAAHQHLLWATGALPGFEIVALSQSCCAQHAAKKRPEQ
ncbi:hypothetical protein [Dongia sedimenti]|uniref:Uncharacterized protein n=1 Tax=Dongia sedimenti TaxID=3064282 RepID=A0ABU0YTT0_9PROT|nr:hypothetical protein [Rhodospirillaceae bacterium R-7]